MKIRFFPLFLVFSVFFWLFITFFVKIVDSFDLAISEEKIFKNNFWNFSFSFQNEKNSWYVGLEKSDFEKNQKINVENVCVNFFIQEKRFIECLDMDDSDNTDQFYTFPLITPLATNITFSVINRKWEDISNYFNSAHLYALNTLPNGKKMVFLPTAVQADNLVVSRAWWGADETLRYVDHPRQKARYAQQLVYAKRPKTEKELRNLMLARDSEEFIFKELWSDFQTTELRRYENGHTLVWPIQKVKKVNRIIVHHTAENIDNNKTDEELIRAIYMYHAVTRWWWDIGYNFLIGQSGKIYEGRSGGDYVVGAHAQNNNIGSVGISVLGNYQNSEFNALRRAWLETAIDMVAKKYGITLNQNAIGFKKCGNNCYPLQKITTKSLLGHKDVWVTNCPWNNIHVLIPEIIKKLNIEYSPVLNNFHGNIDPEPDIEKISYQKVTETSSALTNMIQNSMLADLQWVRYFWQKMRVRLSYPHQSIRLSSYWNILSNAFLDYRRKPIYPWNTITVAPLGNKKLKIEISGTPYEVENFSLSAPVVSIDSWSRIPDWDKYNKYNDNLFRDTIEVFNDNGTLIVVNHLPLEYYLKWLWEVSNTDLPEKIKTITVAARTYARFYMDRKNRKYNTDRYDGSDNPDSFQKYLGYTYELRSPNVARMVDATRWKMIYYKDTLIKPWYFSVSNGKTLSYQDYCLKNSWKNCEDILYLQSVSDIAWIGQQQSWHWVGISGIGATDFAKKGWNYEKIIWYYLSWVTLK